MQHRQRIPHAFSDSLRTLNPHAHMLRNKRTDSQQIFPSKFRQQFGQSSTHSSNSSSCL